MSGATPNEPRWSAVQPSQRAARTQAEKWRAKQGLPVAIPTTRATLNRRAMDEAAAAAIAAARAAELHRATDPVEQAVRLLRQRGHAVHNSHVDGGPAGTWFVSGRGRLDGPAVIAFAATKSGGGDRFAAAKREEAMDSVRVTEAARLAERGTDTAMVFTDIGRVIAAAGTKTAAARRLGYSDSGLANFLSGLRGVTEALLVALYGPAGCVLRPELLAGPDAVVAWTAPPPRGRQAPPAKTDAPIRVPAPAPAAVVEAAPVPLANAVAEAARVDAPEPALDPLPEPEPDHAGILPGDTFTDVGDLLARGAAERAVAEAGTAPEPVIAAAADEAGERVAVDPFDAAIPRDPPWLKVGSAVYSDFAHWARFDAPGADTVALAGVLDRVRTRVTAVAAEAHAAIEAKAAADLAAIDRAVALLAEVG